MCSLTWLAIHGGVFVGFNRDERRTRAVARPPELLERGGVQALAPIDAEAGGTWIAANELGVTLALLNGYRFLSPDEGSAAAGAGTVWRSRGEWIPRLCDSGSAREALERLASFDLSQHRPFELVAFDPDGAARAASYDGVRLSTRELTVADRPFVSSSFDDAGARRERRATFDSLVGARGDVAAVEAFHRSHEPRRGAYSPCMHRDDAQTVSFTAVRVTASRVEMRYQPRSPCEEAEPMTLALRRRVVLPR